MPQADGVNTKKRFVLSFVGDDGVSSYKFKVNPEDYSIDKPQRVTAVKTKSDILLEDYGKDVETITFSGTTGFRGVKENGTVMTGKMKLEELRDAIESYANKNSDGNITRTKMYLYNLTDDESHRVHLSPAGLKISRSKDEPLLFRYELSLIRLGSATDADRGSQSDPEIGNTGGSYADSLNDRLNSLPAEALPERDSNSNNTEKDNSNNSSDVYDPNKTPSGENKNSIYSTYANGVAVKNPRVSTNGLKGNIDNMALIIGYGNGGVSS